MCMYYFVLIHAGYETLRFKINKLINVISNFWKSCFSRETNLLLHLYTSKAIRL
jgi:hypothetical protein